MYISCRHLGLCLQSPRSEHWACLAWLSIPPPPLPLPRTLDEGDSSVTVWDRSQGMASCGHGKGMCSAGAQAAGQCCQPRGQLCIGHGDAQGDRESVAPSSSETSLRGRNCV